MTDAPLSGKDIADLNVVMAGIEALGKWQDATGQRPRHTNALQPAPQISLRRFGALQLVPGQRAQLHFE